MKVQEIFNQLSYGELSQLSVGGGDAGITAENYPKMVAHLNMGLTALYKRFTLKEGRVSVPLVPGTLVYALSTFASDILKVERVLTDDEYEFQLNDIANPYSLQLPTSTQLRVPVEIVESYAETPDYMKTENLLVIYRANHPKFDADDLDPEEDDVELPDSHLEALLYYIASRINNPIGMSNEFHAGNNYYAKYEKSCQELEALNLHTDKGSQSNRLSLNGWV